MLDAHCVVVPGCPKCAHDVPPDLLALSVPNRAKRPRPVRDAGVALRVEHAVTGDVGAVEVRVLGMDVEERVGTTQLPDGVDGIDSLPEEMARVEVGADLRAGGLPEPKQRFGIVNDEPGMHLERDAYPHPAGVPGLGLPVRDDLLRPLPLEQL